MSRIWLDDVAEAISNAHCPNDYLSAIGFKNNLLRQLRDAALNGELACYNSVGKYKPRAYETLISTTKEAVNLWLKSIDSPYRHGQTEAVGDAGTTKPREGRYKPRDEFAIQQVKDRPELLEMRAGMIETELKEASNLFTSGYDSWWRKNPVFNKSEPGRNPK